MINILTSLMYGLLVALALVVGNFLLWRAGKKDDLSVDLIFDWSLIMVVFAILFGRIFFILEHWQVFSVDIFRWIHFIRYAGLSAKGAILGAVISGWIFLKIRKSNAGAYFDLLVLPFLYASFLIQAGCLINSCYGNFKLNSLYFPLATLILIYLFKVIKKEAVYNFFFSKEINEHVDVKAVLGTYFLVFASLYSLLQLILDNFFGNPVYFSSFNVKIVYNLIVFLISTVLLISKLGFKRLKASYKLLIKEKSKK